MKNMLIEKVVQLILTDPKYTSLARFGYFQGFENLTTQELLVNGM